MSNNIMDAKNAAEKLDLKQLKIFKIWVLDHIARKEREIIVRPKKDTLTSKERGQIERTIKNLKTVDI